ncbi:unnamed protein product [Boreogadus saida]
MGLGNPVSFPWAELATELQGCTWSQCQPESIKVKEKMVVNTSDHGNQPLELNKDTCDQWMDELERCAESLIHQSSGEIFKRFIILPSSPFSMESTQTSARVSGTSSLISAIITRIISPGMPCPGALKGLGHLEGFFVHKEEETGRDTRGKEKAAKNRKRVLMAGRHYQPVTWSGVAGKPRQLQLSDMYLAPEGSMGG